MTDEHELRAASDQTFSSLERIRAIEVHKTRVEIGSPEFIELAHEVARLTRVLFRWAEFQLQLANEAGVARSRGDLPAETLTSVEPRPLDRVLALWREAQIRLEIAAPGSPQAQAAAEDIERLRVEYHATTDVKLAGAGATGGLGPGRA